MLVRPKRESYSTFDHYDTGDGTGEHPTQALLDLYTIYRALGSSWTALNGKIITMVGDLKHGRTVHSLAKLLQLCDAIQLNYVSPAALSMPTEIQENIVGLQQHTTTDLSSVWSKSDVVYVTRMQKERFVSETEYEQVKDSFQITTEWMQTVIILNV